MNSPNGSLMEDFLHIPKISLQAYLILEIAMKKTLHNSNFLSLNIYFIYVKIRLHTKNQPPSLPNSGNSYEEDLTISNWKTTLQYFKKNSHFSGFSYRRRPEN